MSWQFYLHTLPANKKETASEATQLKCLIVDAEASRHEKHPKTWNILIVLKIRLLSFCKPHKQGPCPVIDWS